MLPNHPTSVYISNLSEDVWPFISYLPKDIQKQEIAENALLSDRDLLSCWVTQTQVVILPAPVKPEFINYLIKTLGNRRIKILVPQRHTGQICLDILSDLSIMQFLQSLPAIQLTGYTASPQFYQLLDHLRHKINIKVETPEAPDFDHSWTVDAYGSKSGLRRQITSGKIGLSVPDLIKMSPGLICSNWQEAVSQATQVYLRHQGVVMKTDKGHAGLGVLIFRAGDLPQDPVACRQRIDKHLNTEPYWSKFPIVVEQLLDLDLAVGGGNPSVEVKVNSDGGANLLYGCGMRMTPQGEFKGIEINQQIFSSRLTEQIENIGLQLGSVYGQNGYRGYFDVDLAIDQQGSLFVTESNVRRTGGTHVYLVAKHLFGPDFDSHVYTLSQNLHPLSGDEKITFNQLIQKLQPILLTAGKPEGILLASTNLLSRNKIAYVIFGQNKARALALEAQMEQLLA